MSYSVQPYLIREGVKTRGSNRNISITYIFNLCTVYDNIMLYVVSILGR